MLAKLIEKQSELQLNDTDFAVRLGIPRSTWRLTKNGIRPIRGKVAKAAMRAFPEMTADALFFLLGDATSGDSAGTPVALAN